MASTLRDFANEKLENKRLTFIPTANNLMDYKAYVESDKNARPSPSLDKIEHPPRGYKNLNFNPLPPNIGWLKFSVFGGFNHPTHPV